MLSEGEPEYFKDIVRLDCPEFIDQCVYEGINFWPLVRVHLLLKFKLKKKYFAPVPLKLKIRLSIFQFIKFSFLHRININRLKKADFFFYSSSVYYSDFLLDKKYNRYIDPFYEEYTTKGLTCIKFQRQEVQGKINSFHSMSLFNDRYINLLNRHNRSNQLISEAKKHFKSIFECYKIDFNINFFINDLFRIINDYNFFKNVLKKTNCKKVFVVCWYDVSVQGLLMASNKLGINSYDIQHGKQGRYHHLYYHWHNYPKELSSLPNVIFNWSKKYSEIINSEKKRNNLYLNTIVKENLWRKKWSTERNIERYLTNSLKKLYDQLKRDTRKKLLIAIQPVELDMQLKIIRFLQNEFADVMFLVRLHPSYEDFNSVFLSKMQLDYKNTLEYYIANTLPLYCLLNHINITISCWSTVLIESLEFKKKSIVIHPFGKIVFKDDIDNKNFIYSENLKMLKSDVKRLLC